LPKSLLTLGCSYFRKRQSTSHSGKYRSRMRPAPIRRWCQKGPDSYIEKTSAGWLRCGWLLRIRCIFPSTEVIARLAVKCAHTLRPCRGTKALIGRLQGRSARDSIHGSGAPTIRVTDRRCICETVTWQVGVHRSTLLDAKGHHQGGDKSDVLEHDDGLF
jgi:hypothetical protein